MALGKRVLGITALALPFFAACSFVLDFNELQRGKPTSPDAGNHGGTGQGGSSGAATGGGRDAETSDGSRVTGGADGSACGCDDGDPCTIDRCTDAGCVHDSAGAIPDGLSDLVNAPSIQRVTMLAAGGRFYLSALETLATGASEVLFRDFGTADQTLGMGTVLSVLAPVSGRTPMSAAGLATAATADRIIAYVAMGKPGSSTGQVWRLSLTTPPAGGLTLESSAPAATDDNYQGGPHVYPVAWAQGGGDPYGAWPGSTSGIFLQSGTTALGTGEAPSFATAGEQVIGLGPLGFGTVPGVLYLTSTGVRALALGQANPAKLGQCDTRSGTFTSLSTTFTGETGLWLGSFTKSLANTVVAEEDPIACLGSSSATGCAGSPICDKEDNVLPSSRDPASVFTSRLGDPAGRFYGAFAISSFDVETSEAELALQINRYDFLQKTDGGAAALPLTPGPIVLSTTPIGVTGAGPDWPAIAVSGDRLGIAWIQPAPAGARDELHVERYRICFPHD